ncbi:uncharacterized protein [Chelonus insularis]|uniref:uncharacterized protein n=1 Tax=Chelonus insularis TaxID=460826 RepID=UPI00158BBAD3|nr:uncharacterized protein LOC118070858 [Chelonus insularis]
MSGKNDTDDSGLDTSQASCIEESIIETSYTNDDENFVKDILEKWNLSEYIPIFESENINKYVFEIMPESTVQKLIPSIGHQAIFMFKRRELLLQIDKEVDVGTSSRGEELKKVLANSALGSVLVEGGDIDNDANTISTIIIEHLFQKYPSLKITQEVFEHWAKEVKGIWPKEKVDAWYHHSTKKNKTNGILYHKCKNLKRKIRETEKNQLTKKAALEKDIIESEKSLMQSKVQQLKEATTWSDTVLTLWEDTWNYRKKEESTVNPFDQYPLINPPNGRILILKDYQLTQTTSDDRVLFKKWIEIHGKLISIGSKHYKQAAKIIKNCKENLNVKNSSILAWRILPWLFKPVPIPTKQAKKSIKLSYPEQSDGFIRWIDHIVDIDREIAKHAKYMEKFKISIQPYIIAVGPDYNISQAFVIISGRKFPFDDLTKAVDFAWKATVGLDLKYASSSEQVWVFIEEFIYECNLSDRNFISVAKLKKLLSE